MKRILTITALIAATLLLFAACDKNNAPLEGTWKVTFEEEIPIFTRTSPSGVAMIPTRSIAPLMAKEVYITVSAAGFAIYRPLDENYYYDEDVLSTYPEYKNHVKLTENLGYSLEKTSKTSGKITLTDYTKIFNTNVFLYRNLTSRSFTLVIPGSTESGERTFKVTAVRKTPPVRPDNLLL